MTMKWFWNKAVCHALKYHDTSGFSNDCSCSPIFHLSNTLIEVILLSRRFHATEGRICCWFLLEALPFLSLIVEGQVRGRSSRSLEVSCDRSQSVVKHDENLVSCRKSDHPINYGSERCNAGTSACATIPSRMSMKQTAAESSLRAAPQSPNTTDTSTTTHQQSSTEQEDPSTPPEQSLPSASAQAKPHAAENPDQKSEATSPTTPDDPRTRPRQVIAVSASKGPAAFFNLARKFLVTDEICDLSALEGAIVSAADAAHLLERSKLATIIRYVCAWVVESR